MEIYFVEARRKQAAKKRRTGRHCRFNTGEIAGLTIQLWLRQGKEWNALVSEFLDFLTRRGAVDRPLRGFPFVDLLGFIGEARADILEILLYVVMHLNQHLFKFCCCRRRRQGGFRLLCRWCWLLLLYMDSAGMGHFFDFGRATGRARDEFFVGLLLKLFEAWKPTLKAMFLLAQEIVDHHKTPVGQ